jgi:hypothetical protein
MRNLVMGRISEFLLEHPNLMVELDISPDELDELSNKDLLDLLEEIYEIYFSEE